MKKIILFAAAMLVTLSAFAAKPPLDHSVYDAWKSVSGLTVQNDGDWARWTVAPQEGDLVLHLYNVKTGKTYDIERASQAKISEDGKKLVFKIAPKFQETRQAKIDKKKPNETPKDSLGILDLATGKIEKFPMIKAFKTGDKLNAFVAFQEAEKPAPKPDPKEKKAPPKPGEKPEPPVKPADAPAPKPVPTPPHSAAVPPPPPPPNSYRLMWQAFARLSQEEKQKLMEIQRQDPEKFRAIMREKAEALHASRMARQRELNDIARRYRESSDPAEKERLKTELREKLRADFNQRLQDARRDLESNRKRLERMEVELRRREKNQDAIVEAVLADKLAGREPPPPPHRRK